MDIDFIMELLEKHKINNIELARDIQTLAKECYLDGKFDEGEWWMIQDKDTDWIEGWSADDVGDFPALPAEYFDYANIPEENKITLSEKDYEHFLKIMDEGREPNDALKRLADKFNGKDYER